MLDIFLNVFSDKYQEVFFYVGFVGYHLLSCSRVLFIVFFFFTNTVAIDLPGGVGFFKDMLFLFTCTGIIYLGCGKS